MFPKTFLYINLIKKTMENQENKPNQKKKDPITQLENDICIALILFTLVV